MAEPQEVQLSPENSGTARDNQRGAVSLNGFSTPAAVGEPDVHRTLQDDSPVGVVERIGGLIAALKSGRPNDFTSSTIQNLESIKSAGETAPAGVPLPADVVAQTAPIIDKAQEDVNA